MSLHHYCCLFIWYLFFLATLVRCHPYLDKAFRVIGCDCDVLMIRTGSYYCTGTCAWYIRCVISMAGHKVLKRRSIIYIPSFYMAQMKPRCVIYEKKSSELPKTLRRCLDAYVFTSVHICWGGLGENINLHPIHLNTCDRAGKYVSIQISS